MIPKFEAMFKIALRRMREEHLEKNLQMITEQLADALGIERCCIAKINEEKGAYQFVAGVAKTGPSHTFNVSYLISRCPPISKVVENKNMDYRPDPANDAELLSYMAGLILTLNIKSILFVPVIIKGEVEYIIVLDAIREKRYFSDEEIKFVGDIAEFIGEMRIHEQRIKHKNQLLMLGFMSAALAHEMRNPVTVIGGFAKRSLNIVRNKYAEDATLKLYMETIADGCATLEKTFKNVLGFTNLENLNLAPTNIEQLVAETIRGHSVSDLKYSIKIQVLTVNGNPPLLLLDAEKIKIALSNLINNALQHIKQLEMPPEKELLEILIKQDKKNIKIALINTGCLPQNPELIFEPFYTTTPDGAGLGLAITKSIIEAHRGASIKVKQKGGKVEFCIYFPVIS